MQESDQTLKSQKTTHNCHWRRIDYMLTHWGRSRDKMTTILQTIFLNDFLELKRVNFR